MRRLTVVSVLVFHVVYLAFVEKISVAGFRSYWGVTVSRLPVHLKSKSFTFNNGRNHIFEPSFASFYHSFHCNLHHDLSHLVLYSESGTRKEHTSSEASLDVHAACSDNIIQEILDMARSLGPVGIRKSLEDQEKIQNLAMLLRQRTLEEDASSVQNFTDIALTGVHELIYSAAPGGSSGKIGPLDGKVTQDFVNATTFINAVDLGPLRIALTASRRIKDETTISVRFHSTTISVCGIPIVTKPVGGGGVWNVLYTGVVLDMNDKEHPKRLLRVMQTPSLFIIEHKL